jgi:hypothetical protein
MRLAIEVSTRLLALTLVAGLAACASAPVPPGSDTAWHGNLPSGEKFGVEVGQTAANVEETLWAAGYGYEGVAACPAESRALFGCAAGEEYLQFQPVAMDRKGHVYLKIEGGRVSRIVWALTPVAFSDG